MSIFDGRWNLSFFLKQHSCYKFLFPWTSDKWNACKRQVAFAKKQTEKIGTSEMSLVTNSPPTLYPFPFLHEVNIGITSPSTAIYGHSSLFFSPFLFCSFFVLFFYIFCLFFSVFFLYNWNKMVQYSMIILVLDYSTIKATIR